MIIKQFGITLKRLTLEDIELVRTWRNDSEIKKSMNFREHISKDMQLKWFHSINNKFNYYFLIYYKGVAIGVINAKNVDEQQKIGEGGIFIWDTREEFSLAPVYASLTMLNTVFKRMDFFEKSIIQVRRENEKAIYYNTVLGYKENPELSTDEVLFFELTKERFYQYTERLNKITQKLTNDFEEPRMQGDYSPEYHLAVFENYLENYDE